MPLGDTIASPGDKPIFQEEAWPTNAQGATQGNGGGAEDDDDMADLVDYFIGGDWAPKPWSSKIRELVFMFIYHFVLNFSTLLPYLLFWIFWKKLMGVYFD